MTIKDFDYKAFAEDLASQAGQLVPADFKQNEKEYVTTTLLNFATMAGEALYQDQDNLGFSAEQAAMITQIIAEWAFHKSVDLIRSGIPQQYWNSISKSHAFLCLSYFIVIRTIPYFIILIFCKRNIMWFSINF